MRPGLRVAQIALGLGLGLGCNHDEPAKPPIVLHDAATRHDAAVIDAGVPDAGGETAPLATAIATAGGATCAVISDRTLRCWGKNDHGQLGDGTTADRASPVSPKLRGVTQLAMGGDAACAIVDDKSVACWGRIGWRGAGDVLVPTGVLGVTGIARIWVLGDRACARSDKGAVVCWGDVDASGRAGHGLHRLPTPVVGLDHVSALLDRAALRDDGAVSAWGADGVVKATAITGAIEVGVRDGATCGRLADGSVSCVGPQPCTPAPAAPVKKPAKPAKVSKGKKAPPPPPAPATWSPGLPHGKQLALELGWCVVTDRSELQCGDGCGHVDKPWAGLSQIDLVRGRCALVRSSLRCWGDDRVAKPRKDVTSASALVSGDGYGCAIVPPSDGRTDPMAIGETGGIACWGDNAHGELGRGDTAPHDDAIRVDLAAKP